MNQLNTSSGALTSGGLAGDDGLVADLVGPELGREAAAVLVVDRRLFGGNCGKKIRNEGQHEQQMVEGERDDGLAGKEKVIS